MRTGLVLEGGGMRGVYTAGVLDVFLEEGLRFDGLIGVSAGAVHGSTFLAGQHGRSIRYFAKYCKDPRFMSVLSLVTTGNAVGRRFCYHDIPDRLDPFDFDAFEKSPTEFYVAVTNLETGEAEYIRIRNLKENVEVVRASASMPYVSRVVRVGEKKYLDGGIGDGVPLGASEKLGFSKNVVVLTHERGVPIGPLSVAALNWRYRKYPKFLEALRRRPEQYKKELEAVEEAVRRGSALCIRPSRRPLVRDLERDPERLRALYRLGREDATAALPELRRFLGIS
ncbi:MAG: patatin family protein [Clostridiales bacterium]|nr:patatin family protein [Clostridiales bacterium]